MSSGMTTVYKMGFVVDDMYEAMKCYSEIYRVKKWYRVLKEPRDERFVNEEIYDGAEIFLGFSGKTEIELITAVDGGGLFSSFLRENGPGLHRLCFLVSSLEKAMEEYKMVGYKILKSGQRVSGAGVSSRYVFMARPGEHGGRILELTEMKLGKIKIMKPARNMLLRILSGGLEQVDESY